VSLQLQAKHDVEREGGGEDEKEEQQTLVRLRNLTTRQFNVSNSFLLRGSCEKGRHVLKRGVAHRSGRLGRPDGGPRAITRT